MTDPPWADGGCHCGAVRFSVRVADRRVLACNCSICTKKGFLHLIVAADDLVVHQGMDALSTYRFGTGTAAHHFCRTCGIHPFYVPRSHPDGYSVNLRCLDDAALVATFEVVPFDGQRWEDTIDELRESE